MLRECYENVLEAQIPVTLNQGEKMKLSILFLLELFLELGVAGAIIVAAGASQTALDPAIFIGLAITLLAAALFARTYRKAAGSGKREKLA